MIHHCRKRSIAFGFALTMPVRAVAVAVGLTAVAGLAGQAMAEHGGTGHRHGPGFPHHGKPITWEELKFRCERPEESDVQAPPRNVRIQCADKRLTWDDALHGEVPLHNHRKVTTAVFSDKFYVNAETIDIPDGVRTGQCRRFKQVEETLVVERNVGCKDILGFKGTLAEYCVSILNAAKTENAKLVDRKETGKLVDTCKF